MSALASQSVPAFEIAGRKIGPQYPPYVIAEISCNFAYANDSKWGKAGKDYQRCVELIKQAAAAGGSAGAAPGAAGVAGEVAASGLPSVAALVATHLLVAPMARQMASPLPPPVPRPRGIAPYRETC